MRYVCANLVVGCVGLLATACTTELRINGKPAEIPYVHFEVSPSPAKITASARLKVTFRSVGGLESGQLEARLEDPGDYFEIDRSECTTLNNNQTCVVMVSFDGDHCKVGATAEPQARLIVQSEQAGSAAADLIGQCNTPARYITAAGPATGRVLSQ